MRRRDRATLIRALVILTGCVAAVLLALGLMDHSRKERYRETRESGNQAFMDEGIVTWNGEKYRRKTSVTTILIAGIDRNGDSDAYRTSSFRSGGQADFLLLLAIDHGEKKVFQLQIDRDTMTDVTILGTYGNETGTRVLQICLAHSFGAYPEDNARYTVKAVSDLLGGVEPDGYYMVDYSAVPILNDALGGVTVTMPEDMTGVNPDWTRGASVTLHGSDAEAFVRSRQGVGLGTNEERMNRQNIYIQSAITRMNQRLSENADHGAEMLSALREAAVTNMTEQRLLLEINQAHSFEVMPADSLRGEHLLAENGFVEFHPEEGSAEQWVMEHLYTLR